MKNKYKELIADYLQGALDQEGKKQVEELLASGEIDLINFRAMEQLYDELDLVQVPEPSLEMNQRFYFMLEEEHGKSGSLVESISQFIIELISNVTMPRLAYTFILLVIGGFIGGQLNNNNSEIEQLTAEMQSMREMMMVSMLEGPSTTDRLKAVNISSKLASTDQKAVRALLFTLNNDPSINVRIQTIEALSRWGDNPMVREGLVKSISNQNSDIVIVTLADTMVELGVKNSAEQFQRIIQDRDDLPGVIKQKLENSIAVLS